MAQSPARDRQPHVNHQKRGPSEEESHLLHLLEVVQRVRAALWAKYLDALWTNPPKGLTYREVKDPGLRRWDKLGHERARLDLLEQGATQRIAEVWARDAQVVPGAALATPSVPPDTSCSRARTGMPASGSVSGVER